MHQKPMEKKRLVAYFTGFESYSVADHRERYIRSAAMSSKVFGFNATIGPLENTALSPRFTVKASAANWAISTQIEIFDHLELISKLKNQTFFRRLFGGYRAALIVLIEGGFLRYLTVSWRFALFFLYPFLLMALGLTALACIALVPFWTDISPLYLLVSLPLAIGGFANGFLPLAERLYLQHSMALWRLAVKLAAFDDPVVNRVIERQVAQLAAFFRQEADEYIITSFSLGGSFMVHAFGLLLEQNPELLKGKSVGIATLGGACFQCSLLKSASIMRARLRTILKHDAVFWLDVQCYSDIVNFYEGRVARDHNVLDGHEPAVKVFHLWHMLDFSHYLKIKWDAMRMHRQFVFGSDLRSHYDFTVFTAGPFTLRQFADFTPENLPNLGPQGDLLAGLL